MAATFVVAMNRIDVLLAVNTFFVLNSSKTGGVSVGWIVGRINGPLDGHTRLRFRLDRRRLPCFFELKHGSVHSFLI